MRFRRERHSAKEQLNYNVVYLQTMRIQKRLR